MRRYGIPASVCVCPNVVKTAKVDKESKKNVVYFAHLRGVGRGKSLLKTDGKHLKSLAENVWTALWAARYYLRRPSERGFYRVTPVHVRLGDSEGEK